MKKYDIKENELKDLNSAIESDTTTNNNIKKYGENVKNWVKKVSNKAIEKETITQIIDILKDYLS